MNASDAFAYIVGEEGVLSTDKSDPGNWTGGKVGMGTFKGTKYGVSAASYPLLDIANLTLDQGRTIFKADFWDKLRGDSLPYPVALLLTDFGYNAGISQATRTAQHALGLALDGVLGPQTLAALKDNPPGFYLAFTTWRVVAYTQMPLWGRDGGGWTTRAIETYTKVIT